jgi:spermidine synthase
VSTPLREVPGCKYYNSNVHRASFVLPEFGRAMIDDGKMILTDYAGVRPGAQSTSTTGKKVLLLGSGFVAGPCADYVTRQGHNLTIACRTLATAEGLCAGLPNATPASVDVNDPAALDAAVAAHDLVISLIPYTYHAAVIKSAIKAKKHVVTTSYVSPAMKELDAAAKEAGIIVMNEIGLDPGIDHLWAIKALNEVKKEGGKVNKRLLAVSGAFQLPC